MTNGDYAYIISTLSDIHPDEGLDYWWRGFGGINRSETEKAWHSVLTLVPRPYNVSKTFQQLLIDKSKSSGYPWNKTNYETQDEVSTNDFIRDQCCF